MRRVLTSFVVLGTLFCSVQSANADSITFTFNCTIQNTTPATCTPGGGPFGSLTLTDSSVNANRVDVDITILSPPLVGVTGIDEFYINYNNAVTVGGAVDRTFGMVSKTALAGDHTSVGDIDYNSNSLGPFNTTLDVSLDPSLNPGMTWSGSMVIYSTLSGHAESNLDVSMFQLKDADNLLYAAFNTLPANQNQQYGATGFTINSITPVPEPASVLLLGTGMVGIATAVRRRRKKQS